MFVFRGQINKNVQTQVCRYYLLLFWYFYLIAKVTVFINTQKRNNIILEHTYIRIHIYRYAQSYINPATYPTVDFLIIP